MLLIASLLLSNSLVAAPPGERATTDLATNLIAGYRKTSSTLDKSNILVSLRPVRSSAVRRFLDEEYNRLDMEVAPDAMLGGVILQTWAIHLDKSHLPTLLFEGLFHDDEGVVRAAADAAAKLEAQTRTLLSV